jgi:hypothetical protein
VSRVLSLADALGGQLASLGPGVRSVSVDAVSTWQVIRIGAASGDALLRLAEDLELDPGRSGRWRRMLARPSGAIVVAAGVYRGDGKP